MAVFVVRDISGRNVLSVDMSESRIALTLDGQCTLRGLRLWLAPAFMLGAYPKSRVHAQALAAVEAAARSQNLTYVSYYQGETPHWVKLLKGMAVNHDR